MDNEIVYPPNRRGVRLQHAAPIAGGFFVFIQLLVLEGVWPRVAFAALFAVFLLLVVWLSRRYAQNWPEEIVINTSGIRYGSLKSRHGVECLPWGAVMRMDLFYSDARLPPHLRIGLQPGALPGFVRRNRLQRGLGFDVNIPVAVNVAPEVVLESAQRYWRESTRATG